MGEIPTTRTLHVDGLANARELVGLRRRDGSTTPRGVFYRSDNVDWATPAGWNYIHAAGIRTVVDLRQAEERARDTSPRPGWVTAVEIDLDGLDNTEFWANYWDNGLVGTALYFLPHLSAMPERAAAALSAIVAAPPGGVLFHCMGGRDRTGMIALLLLIAAGTEPEAIVDDYLETVRRGDIRAATYGRDNMEPQIDAICQEHGTTTTEGAFRTVVASVELETVLSAAGMPASDRDALRNWRRSLPSPSVAPPYRQPSA